MMTAAEMRSGADGALPIDPLASDVKTGGGIRAESR